MTAGQLQTHEPCIDSFDVHTEKATEQNAEGIGYCAAGSPAPFTRVCVDLPSCQKHLGESQMGGNARRLLKYILQFSRICFFCLFFVFFEADVCS